MKTSKLSAWILYCGLAVWLLIGCGSEDDVDDSVVERQQACSAICQKKSDCGTLFDESVSTCTSRMMKSEEPGTISCFVNCDLDLDCGAYDECRFGCIDSGGLIWTIENPHFDEES